MFSFSEIVGHEQIKEHMQAAIRDKKPFHAYLFQGEEGVGKEALARTFAAGLQCQSESADKPCKECVSCRQMESGNQPDVIWVTRERRRALAWMKSASSFAIRWILSRFRVRIKFTSCRRRKK